MLSQMEGEVPARHRRSSSRGGIYSGQADVLFDASRPGSLNGIEDVATRPDLANRPLFLTLEQTPLRGKKRCASAERGPCNASASDEVDESPWRQRPPRRTAPPAASKLGVKNFEPEIDPKF